MQSVPENDSIDVYGIYLHEYKTYLHTKNGGLRITRVFASDAVEKRLHEERIERLVHLASNEYIMTVVGKRSGREMKLKCLCEKVSEDKMVEVIL